MTLISRLTVSHQGEYISPLPLLSAHVDQIWMDPSLTLSSFVLNPTHLYLVTRSSNIPFHAVPL